MTLRAHGGAPLRSSESGTQTTLRLGEAGPLSQGVQAGWEALRIRHKNDMEVHEKEAQGVQESGPGGSSEPPELPICFSLRPRPGHRSWP